MIYITQCNFQVNKNQIILLDQQDQRAAVSHVAHVEDVPLNQAGTQPFSSSIIIDQANTGI